MVLGGGSCSSWKHWARDRFKASAAVKRVYDSSVRKVGFAGYAFVPSPTGLELPQNSLKFVETLAKQFSDNRVEQATNAIMLIWALFTAYSAKKLHT